ncbi:response regulator [Mucilaginibacter calamicampi]|uniref:Response regulator n=1 Tax=Mucilaginibacter calamicampi TaxID=1302352 RepID=A0ABW2YYI2_9SPHI
MKSIHILLVEDNEGDILLTTEALEESKIINQITVIRDGKQAIDYFENVNGADIPELVLLDINLPKKSGQDVLYYIKTHSSYKQIPVIMLTTSSSDKDITAAYKNHVNCYITKPIEVEDFMKAIAKIEDFWINIVSIPKE